MIEQKMCNVYVYSLHLKAKLMMNPDRERQRERDTGGIKHRGLHRTFFSFKWAVWKNQDHSLQSSV